MSERETSLLRSRRSRSRSYSWLVLAIGIAMVIGLFFLSPFLPTLAGLLGGPSQPAETAAPADQPR